MPATLRIQLTEAQEDVLSDVAKLVLGPGSTRPERMAWAEGVAIDALRVAIEGIYMTEVETCAMDQMRQGLETVGNTVDEAWPKRHRRHPAA